MSSHQNWKFQTSAVLLLLLSSCVRKSEYDTLQVENQALQTQLDQASRTLLQSQAELSSLHAQMQQFLAVQVRLKQTQHALEQSQDGFQSLETKFKQFCTQRRSAMVGRQFPVLQLEDGKELRDVEVTAVTASAISLQHSVGVLKVDLANSTPDLRFDACYDPEEAAREQALEKLRANARQQHHPAPAPAPALATAASRTLDLLRSQLASQRQQLNTEYQTLAAKNPAALRGAAWDSSAPEASPLLNSLSGSRAVLGISHLQAQCDAIRATLRQLRDLEPAAR